MLKKILFLLLVLVCAVCAQTPSVAPAVSDPTIVLGVGASGLGNATGHVSGWVDACYMTGLSAYTCAAEDFINGTTSTRVGLEKILWRHAPWYVSWKGDAGVATGALGTSGTSYGTGVSVLYDASKKKQTFLVLSSSYLKSNATSPVNFQTLNSQLVFRFGLMLGH